MILTAAKEYYLPKADGIREDFWLSKISGYRLDRVVFLCGLLHLTTVAAKFRDRGWIVEKINACACQWYVERFGYAHSRRRKWLSLVRVPPEFQNGSTRQCGSDTTGQLTRFHILHSRLTLSEPAALCESAVDQRFRS